MAAAVIGPSLQSLSPLWLVLSLAIVVTFLTGEYNFLYCLLLLYRSINIYFRSNRVHIKRVNSKHSCASGRRAGRVHQSTSVVVDAADDTVLFVCFYVANLHATQCYCVC